MSNITIIIRKHNYIFNKSLRIENNNYIYIKYWTGREKIITQANDSLKKNYISLNKLGLD